MYRARHATAPERSPERQKAPLPERVAGPVCNREASKQDAQDSAPYPAFWGVGFSEARWRSEAA